MAKQPYRSNVAVELKKNRLKVSFKGFVTKSEMGNLYTDVRFGVADLKPKFDVISDFTECYLMYLNALGTFKKIYNFLLLNKSDEIIWVISPKRVISKQIINYYLRRQGYKPTYVSTVEEAEEKIENKSERVGLRFHLHQQPVDVMIKDQKQEGHILDISTKGCAINTPMSQPKKGEEIQVKFTLNQDMSPDVFDLKAKVVKTESYSFSVKFLDLSSDKKGVLLKHLVEASEREMIDPPKGEELQTNPS